MKMLAQKKHRLIHCIGDSHANFFCGSDIMQPEWPDSGIKNYHPLFRAYRIGPVLAYNLCRLNTTSRGREKLFELVGTIPVTDYIMLCFGEIDCRAHILLQAEKQKRTSREIARDVADRYFTVIEEIKDMGFNIIVWNVIPSAPDDVNSKINVPAEYLFYGSCSERNLATKEFNGYLKKLSLEKDVCFLDFFDKLMNGDGSVKLDYYLKDDIHLSQKAMPFVLEALSEFIEMPEIEPESTGN